MALDRQSIARRDFPAVRRGYDPAAVDRHLSAIADEVDELQRRATAPGAALATQTSEQVRAIIEAAETSAAGIRDSASAEARGHVARVAEAADALRERIDALEQELTGMLGTLRAGAQRLRSELDAVAEGTARLSAAASTGAAEGGERAPATALGVTLSEVAAAGIDVEEDVDEEPPLPAVAEAPARSTDVVGAKIVAFEWALQGRSREQTARHLAEHYDLPDPEGLLEEAFNRAGGT